MTTPPRLLRVRADAGPARREPFSLSAADYLDRWIGEYALAQSRHPRQIDATVRQLRGDAQAYGIAVAELEAAAGGNLRHHVKTAIELWSGERE